MKENIQEGKLMEKEKNIMRMEKYNSKEYTIMEINGMVLDMID